jgi:serine/threonine-protein kinase RsbW
VIISQTIVLPPETGILAELRTFITGSDFSKAVDGAILHSLELAADEIATNVIEHAPMPSSIYCRCSIDEEIGAIFCEISWQSPEPFRPEKPEQKDIRERVMSLEPGGLGIFLIHHLVDDIEYDYFEGRSVIRLMKKL